jgi:electron transport complex protein RnfC
MSAVLNFDSIVTRIRNSQLWQFPGGIHPPGAKSMSNTSVLTTLPLPETLYVPIKQHTGMEGEVIVSIGEQVLKGQALTHSSAPYSVPVHAPTSGTVIAIQQHPSAHPSGVPELTIILQPDGNDTWKPLTPINHYQSIEKSTIIEAICDAGISGLGGAGFPTHIKVAATKPIEFLIINGIECEPYISSDDRIMREHAWQIRQGIDVLVHLIQPKCVVVAVEDNKPEALQALEIACQEQPDYIVASVPTKYPAGGEKQLIQVLTGREVPGKGLPADVGCAMFNVGTSYAIADAIFSGKPLIERVVTVTGKAVRQPTNVWTLLGTPVSHLLAHCGYMPHKQNKQKVIMGGPMMGFIVTSMDTPVVKITNCLLLPADKELPNPNDERACIRCGLCADACPASLLPQQLYWYSKAKEYDKSEEYNLFDCIECGACAYVCPSEIPLVHYYRIAKSDVRSQRDEKDKSEKAKLRFEARKARLLEEKQLREEKHRLAAEQRQQAMNSKGNDAKDKIAAALARAKAKKAAAAELNSEQTAKPITAAENVSQDNKQSKVQAAIARAKAKKAAAATELKNSEQKTKPITATEDVSQDNKQSRVQAAIARAKAKKAAAAAELKNSEQKTKPITATENVPQDNQSAKVQSVIAEAKDDELTQEELKKRKVAIAIAKAKARKHALESKESPK